MEGSAGCPGHSRDMKGGAQIPWSLLRSEEEALDALVTLEIFREEAVHTGRS